MHLGRGRVYVDPSSLSADWETWRQIFFPKYAIYASDYEDAVVVDVGAHKGYFGALAMLGGARAILSYEPEARNFALLDRAARSFRDDGTWVTRKAAVGAEARRAELHLAAGPWGSWSHSLLERGAAQGETHSESVDVVSMEAVLREAAALGDRRLVVKVDAEGAECEIVLGTDTTSWQSVDEVLLEYHEFAPCKLEEIVSRLDRAGLARQACRHDVERFSRTAA